LPLALHRIKLATASARLRYHGLDAVSKWAWLGAATKTVRLHGKELQQRHGHFETAS
jgi:hypothetical protein